MDVPLVRVEKASKKFCRRLRRSLWYGVRDLGSELIGRNHVGKDLRKDEFWAVRDVSFELRRGETVGLVGPNGAGKTTLLRLLNGLLKIDGGKIQVQGRMQALIALGAGFNPILSGRENIYVNAAILGIPKPEVAKKFDDIVDFSGVREFIDTPVQSYSSGMAVRLGFAVAAHLEPDILLVDEVLAVGDEGFQSKCLNKIGEIKRNGAGIILVSHNMHTISTFSQKIILMHKGVSKLYDDVYEGVKEYRKLFSQMESTDIQKICSGNPKLNFYKVDIERRRLSPGDSFSLSIHYQSAEDYSEVQIDTRLVSSNTPETYFQAINKAYDKAIDLKKGSHTLNITVENIQINDSKASISFAIWKKFRNELLFWWKIPIEFEGKAYSTGKNFLNIRYEHD